MKLAIIAGGKGKRLGLKDIPKPMVKIGDKPILEYQIEMASRHGINDIFILSGYLSETIVDYFKDGKDFGIHITHLVEDIPLGTAGAVTLLKNRINERFMVFYGDTVMDINLDVFMEFDNMFNSIASILVHPNDHPYDSDLLEINRDGIVTAFHSKPHDSSKFYRNLVNAGLYILSPKIFNYIPCNNPSDFGKDIFPLLIKTGEILRAYNTPEYIKDMGTPERFEKTKRDFLSGKVARLNKNNKRKAIFLDRDGVLNKEIGNLHNIDDFELMNGAAQAIKAINASEYLAIVTTNQPVIAKGFCTEDDLFEIHKKMDTLLGYDNAYLDGVFYCPHHPERGFEGEVKELKIDCDCRKPKTGLIYNAAKEFNINLESSFLIGDRYADIKTGKNAGIKTILVNTGHKGDDKNNYDVEADRIFNSLVEAVEYILNDI